VDSGVSTLASIESLLRNTEAMLEALSDCILSALAPMDTIHSYQLVLIARRYGGWQDVVKLLRRGSPDQLSNTRSFERVTPRKQTSLSLGLGFYSFHRGERRYTACSAGKARFMWGTAMPDPQHRL
jgi:hypothetical protein